MSSEERGRYRAIHSVLLDSPEFLTLSPPAKLVFYTLRFCRENTIACIFVYHSWDDMVQRTGLSSRQVTAARQELIDTHWIAIQYPIVWLRNGLKFSPDVHLVNPKHRQGVLSTLSSLPKLEIVAEFCTYYSLPIPMGYPSNSHGIQRVPVRGMGKGTGVGVPVPEKEQATPRSARGEVIPPGFEELWEMHPGPKGPKGDALKAYSQIKPPLTAVETMRAQLAYKAECEKRGLFCAQLPHLHRWIRKRRWEDEIPTLPLSPAEQLWQEAQEEKRRANSS